jgi:O-antigen ligase
MLRKCSTAISILATIALILPVFSGYVLAFTMLLTQVTPKWRSLLKDCAKNSIKSPLSAWNIPIAVFLLTLALATLISYSGSDQAGVKEGTRYLGNAIVKYGLLWLFMANFLWIGVRQFNVSGIIAGALGPIMSIHFVYCLFQRQFGIDWVHGFDAVLPLNRFAYDVYRVSGFSSHPLTLGYQLCFVFILSLFLASRPTIDQFQRRSSMVASVAVILTLAISGSRGPFLVALLSGIFVLLPKLSIKRLKIMTPISIIGVLLFWQMGLLKRFQEISWSGSGDSRVMDWKVHWSSFIDNPIFGLGPCGFKSAILAYYTKFGGDAKIGLAHNMYLQILSEVGLLGFLGFVFWLSAWPKAMFDLRRNGGRHFIAAVFFAMLLSGVTQNSLRDSGVLFTLTLTTMVLTAVLTKESRELNDYRSQSTI